VRPTSKIVMFVRYAVWYDHMNLHLVVAYCCSRYDFEYESFMLLSHQYIQRYCWSVVSTEDAARMDADVVGIAVHQIWCVLFGQRLCQRC